MMKWITLALGTLMLGAAWAAVVVLGTLYGWTKTAIAPHEDTSAFFVAASDYLDAHSKGNAALAMLDGGMIVGEHFTSAGNPVDADTLFQVASMSKWITSWGVMALVEAGRIDLDAPVDTYLTRWNLPPSEFDNAGVTVRRLLSHTAGLTDGLGYGGFDPGVEVQSLEDSLTRAADASPGRDGRVAVGVEPGSEWRYSGGGYTLLQLLIEEVSGRDFNTYMHETVFSPLGMTRSTFIVDGATPNVAEIYDVDGSFATHYRFTALAAASLYTSTADMARFLAAHYPSADGEPAGRGILSPDTLRLMREPVAYQYGAPIWGLGTMLFAPNRSGSYIIGHDSNNYPAINTAARFDPATGDGLVVLETGNALLASELSGEWVFWKIGELDLVAMILSARAMLTWIAAGWAFLISAALVVGWRLRSRRWSA